MEVFVQLVMRVPYELIEHSLMGGCLMIGVITLVNANQTFVLQSDEY
jgi:hypothetical protein